VWTAQLIITGIYLFVRGYSAPKIEKTNKASENEAAEYLGASLIVAVLGLIPNVGMGMYGSIVLFKGGMKVKNIVEKRKERIDFKTSEDLKKEYERKLVEEDEQEALEKIERGEF